MVQLWNLPPKVDLAGMIGQGFGQGIARGSETGINQSRLQAAFNELRNNPTGNFQEQLAKIAPVLLTTPGGAQALAELAPILGTQAQNAAIQKSYENSLKEQEANIKGGQAASVVAQNAQQKTEQPPKKYRQPQAPISESTPFPQITAGPQPQKELSPSEIQRETSKILKNSADIGKPITYQEAKSIVDRQNADIRNYNNQILQEKQLRDAAQKEINAGILNRAESAGLLKDPEDRTVAEKFATEAQNSKNETEAWEYVRSKMRAFDSAKSAIRRELGLGGPFTNAYRKMNGTYKDFEEISKSVQKPLDFFREHGLYDEGLNYLVNDLGFGNEQAHLTMFPFNAEEKKSLESFPKNSNAPKPTPFSQHGTFQEKRREQFPEEHYALPDNKFQEFKDQLASMLNSNPELDLVSLRGNLNQDKRYDWHDIYRAIDELVDERRFTPDVEQDKQLNTIRQAPQPGMGAYFQFLWSGKK